MLPSLRKMHIEPQITKIECISDSVSLHFDAFMEVYMCIFMQTLLLVAWCVTYVVLEAVLRPLHVGCLDFRERKLSGEFKD